ncbi:hypothetical protein [Caballeronia sp. INDeC2]|uniref:hypothetical protein n=1 Tax=Caballeronia sp. INDeC2 TaxID=2921747 RepID=UPI0020287290|nr:hypothetical protein [Caballeronia sp. INDeC2]
MGWQSAGLAAEERKARKALTINLATTILKPTGKETETQETVEEELGLRRGVLADMLCETKPGVEDWHFALLAGKGYDKGRGRLTDQFVFEFGLGQLVEFVQNESGLIDAERAVAEQRELDNIKVLLKNRHEANRTFAEGLDNVRQGEVPWSKNGRRKKWKNATSAERRASFDGWFDKIEQLGCRVLDRGEWNDWFRMADPAGTMEQLLWHWCDGDDGEYSAGCPPWVFGVDVDYWNNYDALNSPEFLDSLILVTESDMPYSPYHAQFEQPNSRPLLSGYLITREVTGFRVIDGELQFEPDFQGDDIGAWLSERWARVAQATQDANALIDRASRRKSGGAHG